MLFHNMCKLTVSVLVTSLMVSNFDIRLQDWVHINNATTKNTIHVLFVTIVSNNAMVDGKKAKGKDKQGENKGRL